MLVPAPFDEKVDATIEGSQPVLERKHARLPNAAAAVVSAAVVSAAVVFAAVVTAADYAANEVFWHVWIGEALLTGLRYGGPVR